MTVCAVDQNRLANGVFSEWVKGAPVGWRVAGDTEIAEAEDPAEGDGRVLRLMVSHPAEGQGQVSQMITAVQTGKVYEITGRIQSSVGGAGFLQVKLHRAGRELKRINSDASGTEWKRVSLRFSSEDADRLEILCRIQRNERFVGATAEFAELSLVEALPRPLGLGQATAVSTCRSIGISVAAAGDWSASPVCTLRYRAAGASAWQTAWPLVARPSESLFRGSVLDVSPDTVYEVEACLAASDTPVRARVRTWPEQPPVGRTVFLADTNGARSVVLKGTPEAWVRVCPAAGASGVIHAAAGAPAAVEIADSAYVIFDGFTVIGGDRHGIWVHDAHDILISRCDVSGWGDPGTRSDAGVYLDAAGKVINMQSGVRIEGKTSAVRVERNFIHAPRGTANSWQHGHPHGPNGISIAYSEGNHLIEGNDLIAGEGHWWNDGIESEHNGRVNGGPYHDTDIGGNVVAFANDDGVELDGGQMNVRCCGNLFQWTYCGVSCAPNIQGPSYVYRNVMVLGDERGRANFGFKMGGAQFSDQGLSLLFHNTVVSHGEGLSAGHYGKGPSPILSRNNLFDGGGLVYLWPSLADFDDDLYPPNGLACTQSGMEAHGLQAVPVFVDAERGDYRLAPGSPGVDAGVVLPQNAGNVSGAAPDIGAFEQGAPPVFPARDEAVRAWPARVTVAADASAEITLAFGNAAGTSWRAVPNSAWLRCEPVSGVCGAAPQRVRVSAVFNDGRTGWSRGAVTFRSSAGFVRTVFVVAEAADRDPVALYQEAEASVYTGFECGASASASEGRYLVAATNVPQKGAAATFDVQIPRDGVYQLWARCLCEGPMTIAHDSFFVSVDGEEPWPWNLVWRAPAVWAWQRVDRSGRAWPLNLTLSQGRHRVTVLSREPRARLDALFVGTAVPKGAATLDQDILMRVPSVISCRP